MKKCINKWWEKCLTQVLPHVEKAFSNKAINKQEKRLVKLDTTGGEMHFSPGGDHFSPGGDHFSPGGNHFSPGGV